MCKTPFLVSTKAAGLTKLVPYENLSKFYAWMTAKDIIVVYPGYPFYYTIANFSKVDLQLAKHQNIVEASVVPVGIIHI